MITIIILAMVFVFVAMRLWSVLGRRTGHEQPIAKPVDGQATVTTPQRSISDRPTAIPVLNEPTISPRAVDGLRAIVDVDPAFDAMRFLEGAQAAYRMILEAFWRGDDEELSRLTDGDVRNAFAQAITDRKEVGHVLDNRLVGIEKAVIGRASLDGRMASVTVQFDADIAAVTRDADGNVVAGSLSDAVPTHDVWTFSRHVDAGDPNWVLIETDEAA